MADDGEAREQALRDLIHDDDLAVRGAACVALVEDVTWSAAGVDDPAALPPALRNAVAVAAADRVARILRQLVADHGRGRVLRYSARRLQRDVLAALQRDQGADSPGQSEPVRSTGLAVRADIWRVLEQLRQRPAVDPLPDYLPFTADRVEQGMVEAICRVHDWKRDVVVLDKAGRSITFAHAFESRTANFRMVVGFPRAMDDLVAALTANDTYALKLLHVMWARWFEQAAGDPNRWARVGFSQLCQDLCLVKHHKGGFRPEQRGRVADVYDAVTQLEMYAEYAEPGGGGDVFALSGPLWDGRLAAIRQRQGSTTSDLFWRPGPFFGDPSWRADNPYLGHISRRLLQLDRREKWATRLGTDYAMLARQRRNTAQFRSTQEVADRVRHILERTGLDHSMPGRPAMQQRLFEDAHDQLVEIGVLVGHGYGGRSAGDWRGRDKVLRFPEDLTGLPGQLRLPLAAVPPRRLH